MNTFWMLISFILVLGHHRPVVKVFEEKIYARCVGSSNCSACSNCSRCAHCNSGGTCGVCSGVSRTVRRSYSVPNSPTTNSGSRRPSSGYAQRSTSTAPSLPPEPVHTTQSINETYCIITGDKVNIRKGPGISFTIVTQLEIGTSCTVLFAKKAGWKYVKFNNIAGEEIYGYVSEDFISCSSFLK